MTYEQDLDKFGGAALHRCHYDEEPPRGDPQGVPHAPHRLRRRGAVHDDAAARHDVDVHRHLGALGEGRAERRPCRRPWTWTTTPTWTPPPSSASSAACRRRSARPARRAASSTSADSSTASSAARSTSARRSSPREDDDEPELAGQTVYVGIDPGQRFMAAVVFCAVDHEGKMTVFDEIAMQGATAREVAPRSACAARGGASSRAVRHRPGRQNRLHQTGRSDQMEYADAGIYTIPGQNAVRAGINRVKTYLQTDDSTICANCDELLTSSAATAGPPRRPAATTTRPRSRSRRTTTSWTPCATSSWLAQCGQPHT
jgi:hypothetical protein